MKQWVRITKLLLVGFVFSRSGKRSRLFWFLESNLTIGSCFSTLADRFPHVLRTKLIRGNVLHGCRLVWMICLHYGQWAEWRNIAWRRACFSLTERFRCEYDDTVSRVSCCKIRIIAYFRLSPSPANKPVHTIIWLSPDPRVLRARAKRGGTFWPTRKGSPCWPTGRGKCSSYWSKTRPPRILLNNCLSAKKPSAIIFRT